MLVSTALHTGSGLVRGSRTAMHAIQITQLRAFVAVSALGSYTKAAESLRYSEPAVHLQVTALRRALAQHVVRGRQDSLVLVIIA